MGVSLTFGKKMKITPSSIVSDLRKLSPNDFDENNSDMRGPERLNEICDAVIQLPNPSEIFPEFFSLMERLSESELGMPGPLVHTMERYIGEYENALEASIIAKPTFLSVWMLNRILNGKTERREHWIRLLNIAASSPCASSTVKEQAQRFILIQKK